MTSWLRTLRDDRRGNAMVEFAVAAPVLILLYLGGYVLSDMITCNRKVTVTARTLTDLATRYPSLQLADATNIINASAQVMSPYDASNADIRLSEVIVTDSNHALVVWCRNNSVTGICPIANPLIVTIPTNMSPVGTNLILGQVTYTYTPTVNVSNIGTTTLSDSILMLPRVSDSVPLNLI